LISLRAIADEIWVRIFLSIPKSLGSNIVLVLKDIRYYIASLFRFVLTSGKRTFAAVLISASRLALPDGTLLMR
jgi:hypothetical protein